MPDPQQMWQMYLGLQQMLGMMGGMQQGLPPGGMGPQVQAAWDGEEVQGQDCQNEGDGGWGPSTNPAPAFSAGGMKFKGKGGSGKGMGQAWSPY